MQASYKFFIAGLKVLMVCFEDRLATEWYRIYQAMETVVDGQIGRSRAWDNNKSESPTEIEPMTSQAPGRRAISYASERLVSKAIY